MSEMHTNTTTDTDKYILNGVEVTPNEFIDIVTNDEGMRVWDKIVNDWKEG